MADTRRCPECGAELPLDAPDTPCSACLMKLGLQTWTERANEPGEAPTQSQPRRFNAPRPEELAKQFPTLEILELLGHGGMGAVYKARQTSLDRLVALKIINPEVAADPNFAERFTREAKALACLNHPNILTVHDFGKTDDLFYFVMEYIDGVNLRQSMEAGALEPREALGIVSPLCDALQYAHDEGVVHRDIKPENILLGRNGRVKIADFGLAKLTGQGINDVTLTGTHQVIGTPRYMAPEQMEGSHEVDHRADIYSLGVVFYEMLTGELPLGRFAPPSKKVSVDVRLDEVVLRTLEKEPEQRYQQVSEVKVDVETIGSSKPARAIASEWSAKARRLKDNLGHGKTRIRSAAQSLGGLVAPLRDMAAKARRKLMESVRAIREVTWLAWGSAAALAVAALILAADGENLLGYVFILLSFCMARGFVSMKSGPEELAHRKWLVYPSLLTVYAPLGAVLLGWVLVGSVALSFEFCDNMDFRGFANSGWPMQSVDARLLACILAAVAANMLWWFALAFTAWRWPGLIRRTFHPFAVDFKGRRGLLVAVFCALVLVLAVAGGIWAWQSDPSVLRLETAPLVLRLN